MEMAVLHNVSSMFWSPGLHEVVRGWRELVLKRVFDVVISTVLLVLMSPVILLTWMAVRCYLGKPVLFIQTRPGLKGQPFWMVKFRTMRSGFSSDGLELPDHLRITRLGAFLRAASLDELPELWNVLKGDMSLVGPRPLLMEYLPLYSQRQFRRHEVRPGITGWAQINGRNALSWEDKFDLDVWYVDHQSFWLDMKILALTVVKVFRRDGISQEGHATMEKFAGSGK